MDTSFITCLPVSHRGQERLKLQFEYNPELNKYVRTIPGCQWSKTLGCWHIPDTEENRIFWGIHESTIPPCVTKYKPVKYANSISHLTTQIYVN